MQITDNDYKSTTTKNKQRSHEGKFYNPDGGIPSMVFDEQMVTVDTITGNVYRNATGSCAVALDDPAKPLELQNPVDGSVIPFEAFIAKLQAQGCVSYGDVMIFNYSLYKQTAAERDAAIVAVEG